jgi:hypothetical protein
VAAVWAGARSAVATALTASNAKENLRIKNHPFAELRIPGSLWNSARPVHAETGSQRCKKIVEKSCRVARAKLLRIFDLGKFNARIAQNGTCIRARLKN